MKITLYFINWNDSFYIPFIHEHYSKFCQRIVMMDQYSDDNSVELAQSFGMEVRNFGRKGELNDQDYLNVKNHVWKECRTPELHADYVIVCDADEFVSIPWHGFIGDHPEVIGYNMVSESLPKESIFEINTGEYSESYSKQAIFSPHNVEEINYVHGAHKNNMVKKNTDIISIEFNHPSLGNGIIKSKQEPCTLHHFRCIGGVNRIIQRHAEYRKRLSNFNKQHKMGWHYLVDDVAKINEWNSMIKTAKSNIEAITPST